MKTSTNHCINTLRRCSSKRHGNSNSSVPRWLQWTGSTQYCRSIRLYSPPASGQRGGPAQTGSGSGPGWDWFPLLQTGSAPGPARSGYNCSSQAARPPADQETTPPLLFQPVLQQQWWSGGSGAQMLKPHQFEPAWGSEPGFNPKLYSELLADCI